MPAEAIDEQALPELARLIKTFTEKNRLAVDWDKALISATPRRLFVFLPNFPEKQKPAVTEIKGPPEKAAFENGKPTKAAKGFAANQKVKVEDLTIRDTGQGKYVFAVKKDEGLSSRILLEENLSALIQSINFKKAMRWQNKLTFVRPVRWICAMLGKNNLSFQLDGIKSSNATFGHRLLDNRKITLTSAGSYLQEMRKAKVIARRDERAQIIKKQLEKEAAKAGGSINWQSARISKTFSEIINLVEWPSTITGAFEEEFLVLPDIVIETVLQSHQRYIPVYGKDGLLPKFLVVQNGNPAKKELIRRGHERVIRARLADGKFFFEEDIKIPLSHRIDNLKGVVFHDKLGTVFDKQERVKIISSHVATVLGLGNDIKAKSKKASSLLKTDLTTSMVGEFAELQGAIGKEYAMVEGLDSDVAQSIYEHYLPRFKADGLPASELGALMSLSDKIDSVVAYFAIGEIPTSAGDPYGLRRLANAIVSILADNCFYISTEELTGIAYDALAEQTKKIPGRNQIISQLSAFFKTRIEGFLSSLSFDYDIIRGLLKIEPKNPADIALRAEALKEFRKTTAFSDLLTAYNRCLNLGRPDSGLSVEEKWLTESQEKTLYRELLKTQKANERLINNREYFVALQKLSELKGAIDSLFDKVMIMDKNKDIRNNRLALLNKFVAACNEIADLSEIVMPGS